MDQSLSTDIKFVVAIVCTTITVLGIRDFFRQHR